jgi:hypothetical protein
MELVMKIAIVMLASFMAFIPGEAAHCESLDNYDKDYRSYLWLHSQMHLNTKISDYLTGKATISNLGHSYEAEPTTKINDWTSANYTNRPSISLNNFYVEAEKDRFSGGAGIRTFPERDGLVNALRDIEYQFFPTDARDPLKMRWIGVPGVWGRLNFSPNSYLRVMWYETHWSRISPETVPELKHKNFDNPTGNKGFSLFTSYGTEFNDLSVEVGFTRGWGSWPSEERETEANFSPDPYKFSAAYFKFRESFDTWSLTGTAMVKHCEEDAGSIWNAAISFDKELPIRGNPVHIGTSFFIVDSFVQSAHIRTSPWEDLGNSLSFWAYIDDKQQKSRYGIENVLNPEEYGVYVTGFLEKWVSDIFKIKTQMDFIYDKQKHISEQHDSVRITAFGTITF